MIEWSNYCRNYDNLFLHFLTVQMQFKMQKFNNKLYLGITSGLTEILYFNQQIYISY